MSYFGLAIELATRTSQLTAVRGLVPGKIHIRYFCVVFFHRGKREGVQYAKPEEENSRRALLKIQGLRREPGGDRMNPCDHGLIRNLHS